MSEFSNFLSPALIFMLTVAFGFWLRKKGKPYNGLLFNVHKLLALGNVIITTVVISRMAENMHMPIAMIVLLVLAALSVIALFGTGALMSIEKLDYSLVRMIHRISIAVLVLVMLLFVSRSGEIL
ncbi:MAG TPA: hypothetical protein VLM80_12870 [Anaerolineales bacterium]|nr:hypothetical protein [Anaerolineales bacterium]